MRGDDSVALYASSDVVLTRRWESHALANRRCSREREAPASALAALVGVINIPAP